MRLSVRETRAQFAAALSAAERGERVTITRNGAPVAELGPVSAPPADEDFLERLVRVRREMGLDKRAPSRADQTAEEWLQDFNDPAWTRDVFGPEYLDDDQDIGDGARV